MWRFSWSTSCCSTGVSGHNITPAAALLKRRRAELGGRFSRSMLTNGRKTEGDEGGPLRVDTSLHAPIECHPCRFVGPFAFLPEKTVVTLIKAIVIVIALILSLLLFGRFFS